MEKVLTQSKSICIIGNNAKSVAGAMALTHFGISVTLYALSKSSDEHIKRYQFDTALCKQWSKSIDEGSLSYKVLDKNLLSLSAFDTYWIFLDQLTEGLQENVFRYIESQNCDVCLSGIVQIGRVEEIGRRLNTENVFYIPFVFLDEASIFLATIAPKLLLIGEKSENTAINNLVCKTLMESSSNFHLHNLKTIEFTRSCMMNLMAIKLSLLNEMAQLADACAVDMLDVEKILKLDKRLGHGGMQAGWGYGGSTLPKENTILKNYLSDLKISTNIIDAVEQINNNQKEVIFQKLWRHFNSNISNKVIVIWGAGYKSGTGRTKGSAIHTLLPLLWAYDITTFIFDPLAESEMDRLYDGDERLHFISNPYEKLSDADALIIINWSESNGPDIAKINQHQTPVFDARNLFTKSEISGLQGYYTGIGRGIE